MRPVWKREPDSAVAPELGYPLDGWCGAGTRPLFRDQRYPKFFGAVRFRSYDCPARSIMPAKRTVYYYSDSRYCVAKGHDGMYDHLRCVLHLKICASPGGVYFGPDLLEDHCVRQETVLESCGKATHQRR
jgi:hypothetical protein